MKLLSFSTPGFDQITPPAGVPSGGLDAKGNSIISHGITFLIVAAAIFALFIVILSGIQWITSGGDKTKLQAARNRLIFSIVGLAIVLLAFFIINIVSGVFGVHFFSSPGGPDCGGGHPC